MSPPGARDASPGAARNRCRWCRRELPADARADTLACSRKCRQAAWRLRRLAAIGELSLTPARFAYADPPYPGTARKYYGAEPSYAGEVDQGELVASLIAGGYAGWALSTSAKALRAVLPLCPPEARVCPWVKPHGVSGLTFGQHNAWEPVIVVGGRPRRGGVRDWLRAMPARGGGTLPGRKPIAFCAWLFELLGMLPGDELVDLFPGTGVVGRSWAELSARSSSDTSPTAAADASLTTSRDLSGSSTSDASPEALDDAVRRLGGGS